MEISYWLFVEETRVMPSWPTEDAIPTKIAMHNPAKRDYAMSL